MFKTTDITCFVYIIQLRVGGVVSYHCNCFMKETFNMNFGKTYLGRKAFIF